MATSHSLWPTSRGILMAAIPAMMCGGEERRCRGLLARYTRWTLALRTYAQAEAVARHIRNH